MRVSRVLTYSIQKAVLISDTNPPLCDFCTSCIIQVTLELGRSRSRTTRGRTSGSSERQFRCVSDCSHLHANKEFCSLSVNLCRARRHHHECGMARQWLAKVYFRSLKNPACKDRKSPFPRKCVMNAGTYSKPRRKDNHTRSIWGMRGIFLYATRTPRMS